MPVRLGSSAEATFAVNGRGIIVAWNAAAQRLLGYTPQQAIGAQCHDLMHGFNPSGAPMCGADCPVVESCKHGNSARRFEMIVPRPDGHEVTVDVVTVTVYEDDEPIAIHVLNETPSAHHLETVTQHVLERLGARGTHAAEVPSPAEALTARELSVLRLLAEGMRTEDIAQQLGLTRSTIRNHVQNIIVKLGVHSRVEAVVAAIGRGLVETP